MEASTFLAEFIALKTCIEAIVHLRFKLCMFRIPIKEGQAMHIFCNTESVVKNSTLVKLTLNKKHNSVAYHYVCWHGAAGIAVLLWIITHLNLADVMTKWLTELKRDKHFGAWTY